MENIVKSNFRGKNEFNIHVPYEKTAIKEILGQRGFEVGKNES
jgi:hypothetical protein